MSSLVSYEVLIKKEKLSLVGNLTTTKLRNFLILPCNKVVPTEPECLGKNKAECTSRGQLSMSEIYLSCCIDYRTYKYI